MVLEKGTRTMKADHITNRPTALMPKFNPLQMQANAMDLMKSIGRRHAVVYGDVGTLKTHRLKTMVAQARRMESTRIGAGQKGRQVIVFALENSWFGVHDRTTSPFSRYGKGVNGRTIEVQDAAELAEIAMGPKRPSQIICLQHLGAEEVSGFLKAYFSMVIGQSDLDTVFCFDILDELAGRKRHRDAINAINLKSLVLRGKSMGVSVYASATSPTEIPLEIVHQTAVAVFGRMSHDGNLKGMRIIDKRVDSFANYPTYGAKSLEVGVQFFFPQDGSEYAPYFAPFPEVSVGDGGQSLPTDETDDEKESTSRLDTSRKERADAEAAAKATAESRKNAKDGKSGGASAGASAAQPRFVAPIGGTAQKQIEAAGVKNVIARMSIARILMSHSATGTIDFAHRPRRNAVADMALDDRIGASAKWRDNHQSSFSGMTSPGLAGAMHAMLTAEDPIEGERFLMSLFGHGEASMLVNTLARRLREMTSESLVSSKRLDMVLTTWNLHREQLATNKGTAVREAVIVQMHPKKDAMTTTSLPACA